MPFVVAFLLTWLVVGFLLHQAKVIRLAEVRQRPVPPPLPPGADPFATVVERPHWLRY